MKYKFSIVTAIYNTQEYVRDAIDSIINQTLDFENNVQLILVNDGSTDRSGDICKEYRDKYPNNIVYIEKENGGVSSARNRGLEVVEGKYVNFLDSDDKLSKNALEEVWKFFEKHYDEIDFVSIPIYYFEDADKEHILNFKFKNTQVVDIYKNPNYIQLSSASTFFKKEILKKHRFDENLQYAEDVKLINELLLEKKKYGVLNTAKYLYRKRVTEDSAMQKGMDSKNWYFSATKDSFFYLLKLVKKKYKEIPLYYQYVVMYDLQFRLKKKDMELLNTKEKKEYISILREMLNYIDDSVILDQKHYYQEHMVLGLSFKYNKSLDDISNEFEIRDQGVYFRNTKFKRIKGLRLYIKSFEIRERKFLIEGIIKTVLPVKDLELYIKSSKEKNNFELVREENEDVYSLERLILKAYMFRTSIPVLEDDRIHFVGDLNGKKINIHYKFPKDYKKSYFFNKKARTLVSFKKEKIYVKKCSLIKYFYYNMIKGLL